METVLQAREITIMALIIASFVIGAIFAIRCFCRGKYGCGFLAALLLPALLIMVGVVFKIIYQMVCWGAGVQ